MIQFKRMARGAILLATAGASCVSFAFADDTALDAKIESLEKTVASQGEQIQKLQSQGVPPPATTSDTTLGGYGEITYNGYTKDSSRDQADLRRLVLFVGHRFSDRWTFNGEIEWEHAVASSEDRGESEVEQAYLNYQMGSSANLKTGLILMPFGFLNTSHEPPTFYGVERNEIETRIIPSTWREGGISIDGVTPFGLAAQAGVTTGFDLAKFDDASNPLGGSHQELQLAKARDLAVFGALNYQGIPGFTVGGALFTGNSLQGNADAKENPFNPDFSGIGGRVTLWETHARIQKKGWDLQSLYAEGRIGDAAKIDEAIGLFNGAELEDRPIVPERFDGWLAQVAYLIWQRGDASLAPFVRYESFNTQAKMPDGFAADPANADRVATYGLSFKPVSQVVFKTDYQRFRDNRINDRFNVGMGYMF